MRKQIKLLEEYISVEDYIFLEELFLNIRTNEQFSLIFNTSLIVEEKIVDTAKFSFVWAWINNNFSVFTDEQKMTIEKLFRKVTTGTYETMISLYQLIINNNELNTTKNKKFYIEKFNVSRLEEYTDNEFRCLWYIHKVEKGRYDDFYEEGIANIDFNFNNEYFNKLVKVIKDLSLTTKFYNWSFLIESTMTILIYVTLKNSQLKLNGDSIFPKEFYEAKIIQRAMVNLYLESEITKEEILHTVKFIDFSDRLFGSELNKLCELLPEINTKEVEQIRYIDGIGDFNGGAVEEFPFFTREDFNTMKSEKLIRRLKVKDSSIGQNENHFLKERTIRGQIELLNDIVLEYVDNPDEKLTELISKILENDILIIEYITVIKNYIRVSVVSGDTVEMVGIIERVVESLSKIKEIDYGVREFLKQIIEDSRFSDNIKLQNFLKDINLDNFDNSIFQKEKYIERNCEIVTSCFY